MLEYDFQSSIGYWICVSARLFQRAMNEELEAQGITFRQCQVLGALACDGPLTQVELAERMTIEPPTLVAVLDRMERDGLIERVACPGDRRKKRVRPLPKARPMWKKIVAVAEKVRSRAAEGLKPDELDTLRRLLAAVQSNLERSRNEQRGLPRKRTSRKTPVSSTP